MCCKYWDKCNPIRLCKCYESWYREEYQAELSWYSNEVALAVLRTPLPVIARAV